MIFALAFGLIISNLLKVPDVLKAGGRTEYFIKIGLVCMSADIFLGDIIRGDGFKRYENTARVLIQVI